MWFLLRNLNRNTSLVYFKQYLGHEEIIDDWGNKTGSFNPIYGELMSARLCVSPNKGTSEAEMFGSLLEYDRAMTTADPHCLINENSILWIDGVSVEDEHNFVVVQAANWKNSTAYAIRKVTVSD